MIMIIIITHIYVYSVRRETERELVECGRSDFRYAYSWPRIFVRGVEPHEYISQMGFVGFMIYEIKARTRTKLLARSAY